jgi:hypothetical protein
MTGVEDLEGKEGQRVTAIARVLIEDGLLAEVTPAEDDLWLGHELASLIELRRGEIVAPSALPDPRRDPWLPLVTYAADLGAMRTSYYAPFWLLDDGRRVGVVVLGASGGPPTFRSSLDGRWSSTATWHASSSARGSSSWPGERVTAWWNGESRRSWTSTSGSPPR